MSRISAASVYGICRRRRIVEPPSGNRPRFASVDAEHRGVSRHADVGALQDLGAARDRVALDRRDHRLHRPVVPQQRLPVQVGHLLHALLHLRVGLLLAAHRLQVRARAEACRPAPVRIAQRSSGSRSSSRHASYSRQSMSGERAFFASGRFIVTTRTWPSRSTIAWGVVIGRIGTRCRGSVERWRRLARPSRTCSNRGWRTCLALSDIDLENPDNFVAGTPHHWFRELRREAPVHWHKERDGRGFWNVTKYEDLKYVSRNPLLFSSWRGGTNIPDRPDEALMGMRMIMLNMDPPQHVKFRRIVQRGFTPQMTAKQEPYLRALSRRIVDQVAHARRVRVRRGARRRAAAAGHLRADGRSARRTAS